MGAGANAARPRWWQDLRWITALVVVAIAASLLWGLFGPEPGVVVSRETTFITEPLQTDGLPDYRAHVLDLMGRGTPPEANAAVAVLRATWPMDLDATQLAAVCRELGIPDTPPEVAPLVWAENDAELKRQLRDFPDGRRTPRDAGDVIDRSWSEPWRAVDCPPLGDWVARNAPALDMIVAGFARSRYTMPPADLLLARPGGMLVGIALSDLIHVRNVARSLATRAMAHVGEGRTAAAWRDVHALHRLGRLMAPPDRGNFLVTHLLAGFVQGIANTATLHVLQAPGLTVDEAAAIRRDLDALPPRATARCAVAMERLVAVDVVISLAALGSAERIRALAVGMAVADPDWTFHTSLDVNLMLGELNRFYDRIDAAVELTDPVARRNAFASIDATIAGGLSEPAGWRRVPWVLRLATDRSARSAHVAARTIALLGTSTEAAATAFDRHRAEFELVRVAAALAEHRARGSGVAYPDRLEALVPTLLAETPRDPFNGQALHYERRGDGYLLYAVGANGVDDGGTSGDIVKGEWQPEEPTGSGQPHGLDTVIRVPTPRHGLIPRHQPPPP